MDLLDRSVLVLGLGESGLAMAQWLTRQGARLRVADSRALPPAAEELARSAPRVELIAGPFQSSLLEGIELLALSPGLSRGEPIVVEAQRRGIALTGEIELFSLALNALGMREAARIIAITGTNGKTTVTAMAGEMCRAAGAVTEVAGNISPAALTALMSCLDAGRRPTLWVLELSSFQLENVDTFAAEAAVVLNVSDDHLDRYAGLADYAAAKARIFHGEGVQVLNRQDPRVSGMRVPGRRVLTFGLDAPAQPEDFGIVVRDGAPWLAQGKTALIAASEVPLAGMHNVANTLAALAACHAVGVPPAPALDAVRRFKGLPHRVQEIAQIEGVAFYDDSKGTNVGATVAALEGLGRKVVLIAGGEGKGQDFSPLKDVVARHARAVVLLGRDAPLIERTLSGSGVPLVHADDMDQAVQYAFAAATRGDAVLLSPACASFDMYRNYAHRARVFASAVSTLSGAKEKSA